MEPDAPFGVRVVAIAPVATETPMLPHFSGKERVDDDLLRKYLPTIPLGRLNLPEDVARTALFLYLIPVLTGVLSYFFMGESFGPVKIFGAILVLAGVALARSQLGIRNRPAPGDSERGKRGIR